MHEDQHVPFAPGVNSLPLKPRSTVSMLNSAEVDHDEYFPARLCRGQSFEDQPGRNFGVGDKRCV